MFEPVPLTAGDVWDMIPDEFRKQLEADFICLNGEVFERGDVPKCADCGERTFDIYNDGSEDRCLACDKEALVQERNSW